MALSAHADGTFVLPRGSDSSQVTFAMPGAISVQGGTPSYIAVNPLSTQAASTVPILAQNFASAGNQILSKTPTLTFAQMSEMQQSPLLQLAPVGYPGALSASNGVMTTENALHQLATG